MLNIKQIFYRDLVKRLCPMPIIYKKLADILLA